MIDEWGKDLQILRSPGDGRRTRRNLPGVL